MRRELRPHIPAVKCGAHSRLASTVQAIGLQDMESVVPSEVGPSESGVQEGGGASMGPGGTLDWGAPGPSQQPVESLASGLGLAPWWPGLFRGLHHDAGHLGPGGSLSSCQLLGLKDGLGPGQAGLGPRGRQLGQLGLDLPLQVLFGQGHAVHLGHEDLLLQLGGGDGSKGTERLQEPRTGQALFGGTQCQAHQRQPHTEQHFYTLTKESIPDTQHRGEGQGAGEEAQEPLGQVQQGPDAHLLQVLVHAREQPPQQGHEHLGVQPHSLLRPRPSALLLLVPRLPPARPAPPLVPWGPSPASHHVGPVVAREVDLADLNQAPEGLLRVGTGLECPPRGGPRRGPQGWGKGHWEGPGHHVG
uniref:Carabin isoform X1 n=1 Tax=Sus scrofa TaxID=9823 RepID=A0A480I804_PIG